jgi:DNA-binding NarL/FixJ family response regulator
LAEATVKMHVTVIMKTLGVVNRTQAAMTAEKLGLGLPAN